MKITPAEALQALTTNREEFLEGLVEGRIEFDKQYIHRRLRINWSGWIPRFEWVCEISDGVNTITLVD